MNKRVIKKGQLFSKKVNNLEIFRNGERWTGDKTESLKIMKKSFFPLVSYQNTSKIVLEEKVID